MNAAATDRRLRLLLLAPCADGTDTGEAWSTFQWVSRLSRRHDVTVLGYRRAGRPSLVPQVPHARVIEWEDLPLPASIEGLRPVERIRSMAKPGYVAWYFRARAWLRAAARRGERFDLVHQLAPLALRYPSPAAGCPWPLVLGPLGGSVEASPAFRRELAGAALYVRLRALDRWRLAHDPWLRATLASARVVLGVAPYVQALLGGTAVRRFELASETGIEDLPPARVRPPARPGEARLLYVGRVVRTKGVAFAVRALAALADRPRVTLDVVGDGDDLPRCRELAADLGLLGATDRPERIRFHGRVARDEVENFYRHADAFLFPSLREPSGNVIFEAMRHGLPPVACEAGGPGHVVTTECGRLVPALDPERYVAGLAAALRELVDDPALLGRLGAAARVRVAEVALWERKVDALCTLYRELLQDGTAAPRAVPS